MIQRIIDFLNKEYGYKISGKYYEYIRMWSDWWKGQYKPFHEYKDKSGGCTVTRELFSMKMAKTISEDWAAILLNESFDVTCSDKASEEFIKVSMSPEGGVFGSSGFYRKANSLIERAFALGTGAFIVKLANIGITSSGKYVASPDSEIFVDTVDARGIIPLTIKRGRITEAAFATEVMDRGKKMAYIEIHRFQGDEYVVENVYLDINDKVPKKKPLPAGMLETFYTGSSIPLFSILTPAEESIFDGSMGMGMSVYANAIDNLKGADLAFNNFLRDLKLGGKKVFYKGELTRIDASGNRITPDDVGQQLFVEMGESISEGASDPIKEYNPSLRVSENKEAVQAQLDFLSFKCGLGTKRYRFAGGKIITATEYTGDRQDLRQHIARHNIGIEAALKGLFRAILYTASMYRGLAVDPAAEIMINLDDSYIEDKVSKREQDKAEVRDGLMAAWEYRAKWYGEDEETAKKRIAEIRGGIQFEEGI